MNGEAVVGAFASCAGPDCLKDVVPNYGPRVKVYNAIKCALGECYCQQVILATFCRILVTMDCRYTF